MSLQVTEKVTGLVGIGGSYGGDSSDEESHDQKPPANTSTSGGKSTNTKSLPNGVPADFFDRAGASGKSAGEGTSKEEEEEALPEPSKAMAEKLPEGFFDDAKTDAKVSYGFKPF